MMKRGQSKKNVLFKLQLGNRLEIGMGPILHPTTFVREMEATSWAARRLFLVLSALDSGTQKLSQKIKRTGPKYITFGK